jgi:ABC-type multidrug transport system fused ATPase/permease subunit
MFAQEENRVAAFAEINDGLRDSQLRSVWWESTLSAATEMLSAFTTALILYYGGILQMDDAIKLGTLVAFVDYMGRFFIPLNDLSLKYTVMQNAMVASDRIFDLLDETAEEPDPSSPAQPAGDGHIEFRDVTFGYSDDLPVLSNLSFEARSGERIALVGATGAGKTTILSLLTRLYELQSGQILLDGVDIRQFARSDLRRRIGVVPQDVFMFQGTVLDNIRLGHPGIADADAIRAADELHLDDVVRRFPLGYHEPIAERGKNLSAGEKQLIAFARMLVVAPCVLALDEATSNVDSHTEHLLQGAVHRVMAGRTSLIIAHRLSTIHDVDRILVLHAGKLVEQGSHEELMKRGGVYWRLYQLQYQEQES